MFKILIVQSLYNLSDERIEFQILDRISFMRFLDLGLGDRVPDAKTIWLFREQMTEAGLTKPMFEQFDACLQEKGFLAQKGQIIDASIIEAPRQRNSREENKRIKNGDVPEDWSEAKETPERHGCPVDQKERTELLWIQEPYMRGHQA